MYGEYLESQKWRQRLARKATHKALDMPDDDGVNITNNTTNGFGWKELLLAMLGVAATTAGVGHYLDRNDRPDPAPAPVIEIPAASDRGFQFELYEPPATSPN